MEKINKYGVKVGDVFHSSHGYNMTMNDFYQVIEVIGFSKIRVRELKRQNVDDDGYGQVGHERMLYNEFNERTPAMMKFVQKSTYNYKPYIKISDYEHAYLMKPEEYDKEYYFNYLD